MSLTIEQILASPEFYPLRFEGPNLVFVQMTRQSYFDSIFTLPNRIVTANQRAWAVPLVDIVRMVEERDDINPSPKCIFQIAHCGSTLLSRAIDHPNSSLVIREPFALRQLVATPLSPNPEQNKDRYRALNALWALLSRQYDGSESVVVKANVPVNYSIGEMLEHTSLTAGVLLYSGFQDYLVAALKSEERRQWAHHVVREMFPRIQRLEDYQSLELESLSAAQAIAILWLTQIRVFENLALENESLKSLSSTDLFENVGKSLSSTVNHLQLDIDDATQKTILGSELFKRHAKSPSLDFSVEQYNAENTELKNQYAEEITQVQEWCDANRFSSTTSLSQFKLA